MIRAAIIPGDADFAGESARAARLGFTHVEIEGMADRPAFHLDALAETGLFVACVRLGRGSAEESIETRRATLERQKRMITDAAQLGATMALLAPPRTAEGALAYFLEGCELLASFAASRGIRLAVLVESGTVVPDVESAPAILPDEVGIALTEVTTEAVIAAGARLGYVRSGEDTLSILADSGYRGVAAIELK